MSCGCDFSSAGDLRRRCEIHSLRDAHMPREILAGLDRLASAMDRLAAAMEQAHRDRVGPYGGEHRKVTLEQWRTMSPYERLWSYTDGIIDG